jgi:hypothetical protein
VHGIQSEVITSASATAEAVAMLSGNNAFAENYSRKNYPLSCSIIACTM